jgi:triphosphatase
MAVWLEADETQVLVVRLAGLGELLDPRRPHVLESRKYLSPLSERAGLCFVVVEIREVEWQFDAVDLRPVERWLGARADGEQPAVARGEVRNLVDCYMDTKNWDVYRAGFSLRIRRQLGRSEATLKALGGKEGNLRRRREVSQPVDPMDAGGFPLEAGPVADRVRAVAGPRSVERIFEVITLRQVFALSLNGLRVGEIALDTTSIPMPAGAEPARLRRVEVEVDDGQGSSLDAFVAAMRDGCGLHPAMLSKFESGLLALGLAPQGAIDLGPTLIHPSQSVGEVALAVLRTRFATFLAKESGTRLGDDPEDLHGMRVASRRLRAAMALFDQALPFRVRRLREELGWVASALGAVRDLDVQVQRLGDWQAQGSEMDAAALASLRAVLEADRASARLRLLRVLDSRRYARFVTRYTSALRVGPLRRTPASRAAVLVHGPELLRERHRAVVKAGKRIGPDSAAVDYHRLRILCKRLRYAIEFFSEVYPGTTAKPIRRVVALQDLLGMHQDAQVAVTRLSELVRARGGRLKPATIFAMGRVAQRYEQHARELRRHLPRVLDGMEGKDWSPLQRAMKRERQRIAAIAPNRLMVRAGPTARSDPGEEIRTSI